MSRPLSDAVQLCERSGSTFGLGGQRGSVAEYLTNTDARKKHVEKGAPTAEPRAQVFLGNRVESATRWGSSKGSLSHAKANYFDAGGACACRKPR